MPRHANKLPPAAAGLALASAAIFGVLSTSGLFLWFIAIGGFSAYLPVLIAHGKSLFPPRLVGRGITLLNMGTMGGVFLSQTVSGFVIDLFPAQNGAYPLDAYRCVFALQAAFLIASCFIYFGARDPRADIARDGEKGQQF